MQSLQTAQVLRLPQICFVPTQAILGDQEVDNRIKHLQSSDDITKTELWLDSHPVH